MRRPLSLQARLTLVATAVVAITLVLGWALLLLVVRHSAYASLDDSARQQAKDVAALLASGQLPDPVPIGAGTAGVQVVDDQGGVRAVSAGTDRLVPLLDPAQVRRARTGAVTVIPGARLGTPDPIRLVGYAVAGSADQETVLVAVSQAEAQGTVRSLALAAGLGVPVLVAGFAMVCWLLVGRSLQPVSRLRTGAEQIAAAGTPGGRRLPVPPASDEVQRLARTLNGMLDRLEASNRAQRAFVADAAHELRSPLTAIRTQLEVARHHPQSADWPLTADGVLADTDRLARLVDDLLLLARAGDGSPDTSREPGPGAPAAGPVDVHALALEVAGRPGWPAPVTVTVHPEAASTPAAMPAQVVARRDDLVRILVNLVDNAARHARTAVVIAVQVGSEAASASEVSESGRPGSGGRAAGTVRLTVTDDGPGVPEADRERVFERFTRLDEARARDASGGNVGGSGLGLAIVRSLVRTEGGSVHLEGGPDDRGTTVVVSWPVAVTSVTNGPVRERPTRAETMNLR